MDCALIIRLGGFTADNIRTGENALTRGQLLIATTNPGKLRELRSLLVDLPLELLCLTDIPGIDPVEETGETFTENASLKASSYARQAKVLTLADDSGLSVDALRGKPGVHSARYLSPDATYSDRIAVLLGELASVAEPDRSARFVCAMAVSSPTRGIAFITEKTCEGHIAAAPRGTGGFGYDPIFVPDGYNETFAELPVGTKNRISHRALALQATRKFIASLTASRSGG